MRTARPARRLLAVTVLEAHGIGDKIGREDMLPGQRQRADGVPGGVLFGEFNAAIEFDAAFAMTWPIIIQGPSWR